MRAMDQWLKGACRLAVVALVVGCSAAMAAEVGKYRMFETEVTNTKAYGNKFADVELTVTYTAPSGKEWAFWGFFDGDGQGGGDATTGDVWKMRFMPDEVGTWNYTYAWSDGTEGGNGSFECTEANAGKGIIKAYEENPHWFAYNGTEPVWLKSYYETGHGGIAQDFDWMNENVFEPMVDRGYNHIQVNWLMSLCCFEQYYLDGPEPSTLDLALYEEGKPSSTMKLNVWKMMERRMDWLNQRDVGVHMFLGFDGGRNGGPAWDKLSEEEKDFYVKYSVGRLGPYANLAGWNFVWEVEGDRETHELGLARLLEKHDIFEHLRTYQDEMPREHHYDKDVYTFAVVENHLMAAPEKEIERYNYWRTAWTHHMACLVSYEEKPVYMVEGNALWRRYWHERSGATQDDLRQSAWGCATAASSFNWNGHQSEYELYADGPTGLPFNERNDFKASEMYVDIVAQTMNNEVEFYKMTPQDNQLTGHDPFRVWAMAEPGRQYLVFSIKGDPFWLYVGEGEYTNNVWLDTKTGEQQAAEAVTGKGEIQRRRRGGGDAPEAHAFEPPSRETDWVLILRTADVNP